MGGNEQIKRLPERLGGGISKDGLSTGVPEPNDALTVGDNDRILRHINDLLAEPRV
jgi:hypothetical protein